MAKEWLEGIAQQIRDQNREAAEEFGRHQHRTGIIAIQGKQFFADLERCLDDNISTIRKLLQNDPTSSEISMVTTGATQVRLTRSRFPWFDAHITHQDATITLEYSRDPGLGCDPGAESHTLTFDFHVAPDDKLSLVDAGGTQTYATPEDLAQKITETLFAP